MAAAQGAILTGIGAALLSRGMSIDQASQAQRNNYNIVTSCQIHQLCILTSLPYQLVFPLLFSGVALLCLSCRELQDLCKKVPVFDQPPT